jgi:xylulokinase/glycerol kinase
VKHLIALDVGTSSMRSTLFTETGNTIVCYSKEYHTSFPKPGFVEQEPFSWKEAAVETLSKIAAYLKEKKIKTEGVAVTSQRSSLIPVDSRGNVLRDAIMWQDKRTIEECEKLKADYGMNYLYRKTGLRVNPYFVLPKIRWIRKHEPHVYTGMAKALGVQDYVVYCMTGEFVTDYTQAGRTMLMNIEEFRWEPELLRIAGITEEQLPRLVPPGDIAGYLTAEFAARTGLPVDLPVVVCGGDQQNAAVALGVVSPGIAEANTGTGSFVLSYAEQPIFEEDCKVLLQPSAIAGKWVIEAGIFNTGAIYRWFKEQYCKEIAIHEKPYIIMDEEASAAGLGAHGVIMFPHFEGSAAPYWNPMAKGLFFNLSLGTTRGDMNRAILEGIAMEINDCLELISSISGKINKVNVAGGMVKSDVFCQIQASCYGKTVVRYKNSEASSLGACVVSACALGIQRDIEAAFVAMMVEIDKTFEPDRKEYQIYRKYVNAKKSLYQALAGSNVYVQFMDL